MKVFMVRFLFFVWSCFSVAQNDGYQFVGDVNDVRISFELIDNNIIVPLKLNDVHLNFLLDTGATKTILFDYQNVDSLTVKVDQRISFTGYGSLDKIEGFHSSDNRITLNNELVNENADLIVLLENPINMSAIIDYPVNGLLGIEFFENFLVEIDFENQVLILYDHKKKIPRRIRNYKSLPINLSNNQIYVNGALKNNSSSIEVEFMIDTGNSGALWISRIDSLQFNYPKKYFKDNLGYGIAGDVEGIRSKIDYVNLGTYEIPKVTVSIPNKQSLSNQKRAKKNFATIGNEILSRFLVVIDLKNELFYFKPNKNIADGFYYNMAGIDLKTDGFDIQTILKTNGIDKTENRVVTVTTFSESAKKNLTIIPKVFIRNIRENSPAYYAGLKVGDQIIKMNRFSGAGLTIRNLSDYFHSKPYQNIKFTILRNDVKLKKELQLIPLIR